MPKRTVSVTINRPVPEVFDFVAVNYFTNHQKWAPRIVELQQITDGSVRVGAAGRTTRIGARGSVESTFRVSEFEPNRKFAVATTEPPLIATSYEFAATNGSTRLSVTIDRKAGGLIRSILAPILGAGQRLDSTVQEYADQIREHLESSG